MAVARPKDVVTPKPDILFVGINPGATSGKVGHHFAGPANPFYKLLHVAGFTPIELTADQDQRLVEWKLALVGVTLYPIVFARENRKAPMPELPPGPGAKPQLLEGARVFVVPNPSGLNASFPTFEAKLPWFEQLRKFAFG